MFQRRIIGIQVHYSVSLGDAVRGIHNARAGLRGALKLSGDPEIAKVLERADELTGEIGRLEQVARAKLLALQSHPEFKRMVEGELPFPDHTIGGFVPRCTCYDRCMVHYNRVDHVAAICNCEKECPAHREA